MKHISREEFLRVMEEEKMKVRNKEFYNRLYNRVLKQWETPKDWLEAEIKTIFIDNRRSDIYWAIWGMMQNKPTIPVEYIKKMKFSHSQLILKYLLKDYDTLMIAREKMLKIFHKDYFDSIFAIVLRLCLYSGVNAVQEIKVSDIKKANIEGLLKHDGYKTKMANLLYYMGYIREPSRDHRLHVKLEEKKLKVSDNWSEKMKTLIKRFIKDLYNSKISAYKMENEKINGINLFGNWFAKEIKEDKINNLLKLDNQKWMDYLYYINNIKEISYKTKGAKILAIKDFIGWLKIMEPKLISENINFTNKGVWISTHKQHKIKSLAFEKRQYGEKILHYLLNEFTTDNIKKEFMKEAIIIAANSGARISEIRNMKYNSCFYSEDEKLYKIILEYPDKLNQVNRPIYLTKDGYEAVKRVEKLKEDNDLLVERYNKRVGDSYIHLFDYRGSNVLDSTSLYNFIKKIKRRNKLVDQDGNLVKGGMHAFRHMFAMSLFRVSGYNIGVVRYFLGHQKYDMTYQYLEEEKERIFNILRNNKDNMEYSGPGLNTIIEVIIDNKNKEYSSLCKIMEYSSSLSDLIEFQHIKKVSFGYCLKPCDNANRCIRCKNFLLSKVDENEIIKSIIELYELLCYKISIYPSKEKALEETSIQNDLEDLLILIKELQNLGINTNSFPIELRQVIKDGK